MDAAEAVALFKRHICSRSISCREIQDLNLILSTGPRGITMTGFLMNFS